MNSSRNRTVVAVAGLDPTGGAGLVRDVLTGAALGVHVLAVGTAWTVQSDVQTDDSRVAHVEPRDPDALCRALADALRQTCAERGAGAGTGPSVKVGMVPNAAVADAILKALDGVGFAGPVVVDPVLFTSRGGRLWQDNPRAMLPLLRRATLVTPNGPEARSLSGRPVATVADALAAATDLRRQGVPAILVKGGHVNEGAVVVTDVLMGPEGVAVELSRPRMPGPSPRGTGCALSTAIAAELAAGVSLRAAVEAATGWLWSRIAAAGVVHGQRHLP
ncbi:MAG TPA: hydroxymethylpyrimidine/phosphomethylpyrimidine kinase [Polyangia bacterium]|jgi:hydroxymethylpyrimidine/phosphomethylpyrimidine kinase|nr:hydroxymethylpyrimidine/phosphomethylpyrimidine kinase [Polyangia bacterium]